MRKTIKLKELCSFQEGYVNPPQGNPDYFDGEIKWIRAVDLNNSKVYTTTRTLTKKGFFSAKKSAILFSPGTIVISKSGTIGRLGLLQDYMCGNRATINIIPKEGTNIEYIFYNLLNRQTEIADLAVGSVQKNLYVSILENVDITIPSNSEQEDIVKLLKSIDEKIENNRQINDNLEQQAKALYKSWFVDFEPFKDGDFIESEIGEIPAGWSIVKFSDISETPKKTINPQKFPDTTFYHYSLPACDNGLIPEIQIGKDIMSNKIIMQNNTTLFSKLNPRIKRIWFTGEVLPNSICSTEFIPFRAKYDTESSYIFSIVNSDAFYATVMGCVNGATGSHQRFHAEDTEDFLCPYNKDVVNEFSKLVEPILSQMHDLRHENVMLASTRDALLPKLMSGELKINETDC